VYIGFTRGDEVMEWYSIKEYMPPACHYMLIRALRKDGEYDRYFIAMIDDFNKIIELEGWEFKDIVQNIMRN
jgi:hypothetical protein